MKKQTLGMMISSLRKEKGMTQLELAEKMGKTAKDLKKTMNPNQREIIENNIITEKVIKLLKEKNNIK